LNKRREKERKTDKKSKKRQEGTIGGCETLPEIWHCMAVPHGTVMRRPSLLVCPIFLFKATSGVLFTDPPISFLATFWEFLA